MYEDTVMKSDIVKKKINHFSFNWYISSIIIIYTCIPCTDTSHVVPKSANANCFGTACTL